MFGTDLSDPIALHRLLRCGLATVQRRRWRARCERRRHRRHAALARRECPGNLLLDVLVGEELGYIKPLLAQPLAQDVLTALPRDVAGADEGTDHLQGLDAARLRLFLLQDAFGAL